MLFDCVKAIADKKVIAFFSTGKDSCVMLDLISKHVKDYMIVHFYFYKDIRIREDVLEWYERKYGKKIIRLPHPERQLFDGRKTGKKIKTMTLDKVEAYLDKKYPNRYFSYGYRRAESLTRRALLGKNAPKGIDEKNHRVYPVIEFKKDHIFEYIRQNELMLPDDYNWGFHDVNIFSGSELIWLYMQHRNDYEKIKSRYPFIEADLVRAIWESKRS